MEVTDRLRPMETMAIAGYAGGGKDTVAKAFEARGFTHISLSDLVRQEISSRGLDTNRRLQNEIANSLRNSRGESYWVKRAMGLYKRLPDSLVLSGIYAPGEAQYVIDELGGVIIAALATPEEDDPHLRFARVSKRADGSRDAVTIDEFMEAHARENSGLSDDEANVSSVIKMARYVVMCSDEAPSIDVQVNDIISKVRGVSRE